MNVAPFISQLHAAKPTADLLSAIKGNKPNCECHPVPCRTTSACPRPGPPQSFPLQSHGQPELTPLARNPSSPVWGNFSAFLSQPDTCAEGKLQHRTHRTYLVLELELTALCLGKRRDGSSPELDFKSTCIFNTTVASQALIPLRYSTN